MIGISTLNFDPLGSRMFRGDRDLNEINNQASGRRVSRTATLDGGCEIYDTGFTDSDRTVTISQRKPTQEAISFARYICEHGPEVVVSMVDGCYLGVPRDYRVVRGELRLDILIKRRIS